MAPHATRRIQSLTDLAITAGTQYQLARNHPVLQNLLLMVDVIDEQIQRADALRQPPFDPVPFVRTDDARNDVEGKDLLRTLRVAVDAEGDPHAKQHALGRQLAPSQFAGFQRVNLTNQQLGPRSWLAVFVDQFVKDPFRVVRAEDQPLGLFRLFAHYLMCL